MTADGDPTVRAHMHEAIQATAGMPSPSDDEDDALPEGSMLMGWVTIAEWMSPEGDRWLSKIDGSANCRPAATWQVQGYLHNALNDWDAEDR